MLAMTVNKSFPRGSPNALKISALQGYSGKAWTDEPLGLCFWTTVQLIGKNKCKFISDGFVPYLSDTLTHFTPSTTLQEA